MDEVTNFKYIKLDKSNFLHPKCMHYRQNGVDRTWEGIQEHADVQILIFNITRNVFVFVKQFRPAIYLSSTTLHESEGDTQIVDTEQFSGRLGVTLELCAGNVDKDLPLEEIASCEVEEECGYKVSPKCLKKITSCRQGTHLTGAMVTLFYAEVTDSMKVSEGGGLAEEGEFIHVEEVSVQDARGLVHSDSINKEFCLLLALQWFFSRYPNETNV